MKTKLTACLVALLLCGANAPHPSAPHPSAPAPKPVSRAPSTPSRPAAAPKAPAASAAKAPAPSYPKAAPGAVPPLLAASKPYGGPVPPLLSASHPSAPTPTPGPTVNHFYSSPPAVTHVTTYSTQPSSSGSLLNTYLWYRVLTDNQQPQPQQSYVQTGGGQPIGPETVVVSNGMSDGWVAFWVILVGVLLGSAIFGMFLFEAVNDDSPIP